LTAARADLLDRALTPEQVCMFDELVAALEVHELDLAVTALRDEDSTEPLDWLPDSIMVDEVNGSPKSFLHMTRLPHPDRAYLVAGLTVRGMKAEEIADRTHCSLRLIRTIRSWEMTDVCKWVHGQTIELEGQLSKERSAHSLTRRELEDSVAREARLQRQLDQLVAALGRGEKIETFRGCKHPKVAWNTYTQNGVDAKGRPFSREFCRECNNDRATQYRARRKAQTRTGAHTNCVTVLQAGSLASAS